jgi:hypothetical protein
MAAQLVARLSFIDVQLSGHLELVCFVEYNTVDNL